MMALEEAAELGAADSDCWFSCGCVDASNGKWLNCKLWFCGDAEEIVPNGKGWLWTVSLIEFHFLQISPIETQF